MILFYDLAKLLKDTPNGALWCKTLLIRCHLVLLKLLTTGSLTTNALNMVTIF